MKKTILMVDDSRPFCWITRSKIAAIDPEITFLMAHSLQEGREVFEKNRDALDLVVMDGKLDGEVEDTCELVGFMRQSGYRAPILAASSSYEYNRKLISAGCTRGISVDNPVPEIIKTLST